MALSRCSSSSSERMSSTPCPRISFTATCEEREMRSTRSCSKSLRVSLRALRMSPNQYSCKTSRCSNACGSKPCTPGEHQNRWQMDVHPPQYGAIGYAPWPNLQGLRPNCPRHHQEVEQQHAKAGSVILDEVPLGLNVRRPPGQCLLNRPRSHQNVLGC